MTYDEQIELIKSGKLSIIKEWRAGRGLFKFLGDCDNAGCLTIIKRNPLTFSAYDNYNKRLDELTSMIIEDERIPEGPDEITIESLSIFKQYQEEYDKMTI